MGNEIVSNKALKHLDTIHDFDVQYCNVHVP